MADETKSNILDLDAFLPENREVVINKKTYEVSGSTSVRDTLRLMKSAENWEKAPSSVESIDNLITDMQAFFITPIEKEVLEGLDVRGQLRQLITFLYGQKVKKDNTEKNETSQP